MSLPGLVVHMVHKAAHKSGLVSNPPQPYEPYSRHSYVNRPLGGYAPHAAHAPYGCPAPPAIGALAYLPYARRGRRGERRALRYEREAYRRCGGAVVPGPAAGSGQSHCHHDHNDHHNDYNNHQQYHDDRRYYHDDQHVDYHAPQNTARPASVERARRASFDDAPELAGQPPAYEETEAAAAVVSDGSGWKRK